jgi:ferric-dicitrate binding protein FerR (iron transport regulator)
VPDDVADDVRWDAEAEQQGHARVPEVVEPDLQAQPRVDALRRHREHQAEERRPSGERWQETVLLLLVIAGACVALSVINPDDSSRPLLFPCSEAMLRVPTQAPISGAELR